ncbi:tautomerase family protein [Brenneria populi subsp. brevivirga]|uniref:tautomerase family protein n=1 Tax=Brenneria populi TaxID=1505588 RepID=UPI002E192712|nr:tautomerase family protein [Brenneria populi subsp. brevivirga]
MVRVFTSPRSSEQKQLFMKRLAEEFSRHCGIEGHDLMITFINNDRSDWSFGHGEAQYVAGKL